MQVVEGAASAPIASYAHAGVAAPAPDALAAPAPHPCPHPNPLPSAKYPPPVFENDHEKVLFEEKIGRVTCSWRWKRDCIERVTSGEVKYKRLDQAKELRRVGFYPPGGVGTRMIRCDCCGHWTPWGRDVHEEWVEKLTRGQVRRCRGDDRPVCIDCYYAGLPLLVMVCLPSSPGFSTRIPDGEMAAHLEGSGWQRRTKRSRRRYIGPGGKIQEEVEGEDGFVYDLVVIPKQPGAERAEASAAAENEAA